MLKQDIRAIYSAGTVNECVQKPDASVYKNRKR